MFPTLWYCSTLPLFRGSHLTKIQNTSLIMWRRWAKKLEVLCKFRYTLICIMLLTYRYISICMYVYMHPLSLFLFWKIILLSQPLPELALPLFLVVLDDNCLIWSPGPHHPGNIGLSLWSELCISNSSSFADYYLNYLFVLVRGS